jgi:hypothetical protein
MNTLRVGLDVVASGFALGALGWFFFVQTFVLLRSMGRDAFVPLQLRLVRPLFWTVSAALLVATGATLSGAHAEPRALSVLVALGAALVTALLVVPRAVSAGGKSLRETLDAQAQTSATRFTADGGGESTKVWHRVLGLLTVVVVLATGVHLVLAVTPAGDSDEGHHHAATGAPLEPGPQAAPFEADAPTKAGVATMREVVAKTRAGGLSPRDAAPPLRRAFTGIFQQCTMTGPAHEALHGFLLPLGQHLEALERAGTDEAAKAALTTIETHLGTFDAQFR